MPWRIGRRRAEPAEETAAPQRPRDQWRDLPPADRVVTGVLDRDTTAGTREFLEQLPSRWTAPAALQPLGHDVSPDVVSGVVHGLASTVSATATPLNNDTADLHWWHGRRGAQRRATAAGEPEDDGPTLPVELDEEAEPAPPAPAPELPPRPVAAVPSLARSVPVVASRRQPGASTPVPEPAQPRLAMPPGLAPDTGPGRALRPPEVPPELATPAASPLAMSADEPVRVVRVDPGGPPTAGSIDSAPVPAELPSPDSAPRTSPDGPRTEVSGRRRRARLGAPLPSSDPAITPSPTLPPAIERALRRAPIAPAADRPDAPMPEAAPTSATETSARALSAGLGLGLGEPAIRTRAATEPPAQPPDEVALPAIPPAPGEIVPRRIVAAEPVADVDEPGPPAEVPTPSIPMRMVPAAVEDAGPAERAPLVAERSLGGIVRAITSRDAPTSQAAGVAAVSAALATALPAARVARGPVPAPYDPIGPRGDAPQPAVADEAAPYPPLAGGDFGPDAIPGPRRPAAGLLDRPGPRLRGALPARTSPTIADRVPALPPPVELVAPGYVPPAPAAAGPLDGGRAARAATAAVPSDESPEPRGTSAAELDQLARDLYGRVQSQLRAELLVGRERAQRLTDIG